MPQLKVSLSIGFPGAKQNDILEIDDEAWEECKSDEERSDLIDKVAIEWAWSHIDIGAELIDV